MLQPALRCVAGFNLEIFKRLLLWSGHSGAAEWPETKSIRLVGHSSFDRIILGENATGQSKAMLKKSRPFQKERQLNFNIDQPQISQIFLPSVV